MAVPTQALQKARAVAHHYRHLDGRSALNCTIALVRRAHTAGTGLHSVKVQQSGPQQEPDLGSKSEHTYRATLLAPPGGAASA